MKPDEFKKLIETIGSLVDKRAETTEITIKGHVDKRIDALENHLHIDIQASEERQTKRLEDTKEELRAEILTSRAEANAGNLRVLGKLDKMEKRVSNLEEKTETPIPHKN